MKMSAIYKTKCRITNKLRHQHIIISFSSFEEAPLHFFVYYLNELVFFLFKYKFHLTIFNLEIRSYFRKICVSKAISYIFKYFSVYNGKIKRCRQLCKLSLKSLIQCLLYIFLWIITDFLHITTVLVHMSVNIINVNNFVKQQVVFFFSHSI